MTELVERIEPAVEPQQRALTANSPYASPAFALIQEASRRGASIEELDRYFTLHERMEAAAARAAFVEAMTAFKAEPLNIIKRKAVGYETADGGFVGYRHAELSDVTDIVCPAMARHGLSHRWDVVQGADGITVTCIVTHARGHSEAVSMSAKADNSGKKNAIQQVASTVTYLQRYTLMAATGTAARGTDDDAESAESEEEREAKRFAERRAKWLKDQLENIAGARTVKELRGILDYAIPETRKNNDPEAEAELTAAAERKVATAKPKTEGAQQ